MNCIYKTHKQITQHESKEQKDRLTLNTATLCSGNTVDITLKISIQRFEAFLNSERGERTLIL